MTKNRIFDRILKFFSNIETLTKKSIFWLKIKIIFKSRNFDEQNRIFDQKLKLFSKIETLIKNRIFDQKLKFFSKIETLIEIRICYRKLKLFFSKIELRVTNQNENKTLANKYSQFSFEKFPKNLYRVL